MNPAPSSPDTAERSLSHWSEAGRREMEAFYALARLDYEILAGALDWNALLASARRPGADLTLLDVACGSGKFPSALIEHAGLSGFGSVQYDLLDPSAFSLAEAAAQLTAPFVEGRRYESTIEDLPATEGPWDVVWATHALYALDPTKLSAAVGRYLSATAKTGVSILAQGAAYGHYLRVYDAFLEGVRGSTGTPYVSSDDLIAELDDHGAKPDVRRLRYDHVISTTDTVVLEGYLQRCLFDDTISLAEMLAAPVLGDYLETQRDDDAGVYRFHQEVDLVVLAADRGAVRWTPAS